MPKRPFLVTILALSVLCLTIWNAVRFGTALADWNLLLEFADPPGPWYVALTGLFWGLAGAALFPGLWFGWRWARPAMAPVGAAYILYYWADRLFLQNAVPNPNWPCMAFLCAVWLVLIFTALYVPAGRDYFSGRDKR